MMSPECDLLHRYRNGGFEVQIYADGTKIRDCLEPADAPALPEHMDLKITGWCDAACPWCHEGSTQKGKHADLQATLTLLQHLPAGTEIATGGGDPLSHPEFAWFVRSLRARGIVPSVTVNGKHFERHLPMLKALTSEGSLFGVGFSYDQALPDWDYEHLVVHLITGVHSPEVLDVATRSHKVLLLGYKQFGRGKKLFKLRPEPVQRNIAQWFRELFVVAQKHHLSFDNLAIAELNPRRLFSDSAAYDRQYMGEEGFMGLYVDAVTQTYGLSSYSDDRHPWTNMHDMFTSIRVGQGF